MPQQHVETHMAAQDFQLTTHWHFDASVEAVWAAISKPEEWPQWWPAVLQVETIDKGDANGVGARRRMTWRTALPYRLSFDMRTVRVEKHRCIEGESSGQLAGRGIWQLTPTGNGAAVRYDWNVAVTKPWMLLLAPLLRPVFAWNHHVVMGWGEQGLRRRLTLSSVPESSRLPL
jgi:uncharacterized protein YndB with AHSA1/START domain